MALAIILLGVAALAYANGANDNFKGVATLFGSGTTPYRSALVWATVRVPSPYAAGLNVTPSLFLRKPVTTHVGLAQTDALKPQTACHVPLPRRVAG